MDLQPSPRCIALADCITATLGAKRLEPPMNNENGQPVARWWTFAGGQVNHTLKYALEWLEGWKVVPDNFLVRVQGDGITHETILSAIARMSAPGFWESEDTRSEILARVPEYRLSKFQVALPEWAAAEMVGAYLLDFRGTASFLSGEAR